MFGKIIGYKINKNEILVNYENMECKVTIVNEGVINFFAPLFRKERDSKAVEDEINNRNIRFEAELVSDVLAIKTEKLIVKIYDEFKADIYDLDNNILCSDYKGKREPFIRRGKIDIAEEEGHKIEGNTELKVFVSKTMEDKMYFYGFGERPGSLNKKNCHYRNWNTDDPTPHGETYQQLYKSIPFFIALKEKVDEKQSDCNKLKVINEEGLENYLSDSIEEDVLSESQDENIAFGIFFDNHFESHFDLGKENSKYYYFGATDGNLDYYFIYGPTVKNVINEYTNLTGKTPLPQLWTLGYQQCRWAYVPESRVMEIANTFREKDIPCDTIYLDIDYMDGFRVFTWDKNKFENPKVFIDKLKEMGFKVVTIIDPGVKVDKGYKIYDEGIKNGYFATDKDGIVYKNWVWPGHTVFPDFMNSDTRKWWSENQKIMIDSGVAGIWNDMNEPASFNGPLPDDVMFNYKGIPVEHKEIHNIYGHMMDKATYEGVKEATNKRPFVVTRACYAGTQKYSTVWTGDNQSTWEHLRMSIPMLINLGLSGMAFCGTDVGGFGYDCTPELLSRWVQVGAFTPLFRNHSTIGSRDQEPWAFDKETEDINRKYIKLRYKLLPYLYDLFWECEKSGAPIMRPLLYDYQKDKNTYEISDEFMLGDNILVAPVVEQGSRNRMVYLPEGDNWIDYWTGEEFEGGKYIIKNAPLDICPIYIKALSIIPVVEEQNYVGEKEIEDCILTLHVYAGKGKGNINYTHYTDDGESFDYKKGNYNKYNIKVAISEEIKIEIEKSIRYHREYKDIRVVVKG